MIGSDGAAYADDHHDRQLAFTGGAPSAISSGEGSLDRLEQLREFVATIADESNANASIAESRTVTLVAEAIAASIETGNPVHLATPRETGASA